MISDSITLTKAQPGTNESGKPLQLQSLNQSGIPSIESLEHGGTNFSSSSKISDIGQWPLEVLSYMFECYVTERIQVSSDTMAPLALGAVCRLWRHVAWTTPALWTFLQFKYGIKTTETHVDFAVEWLKRSGDLPFSIKIWRQTYHRSRADEDIRIIFPLIDAINQSLSRCDTLNASYFEEIVYKRLFSITQLAKGAHIQRPIPLKLEVRRGDITFLLNLGSTSPKEVTICRLYLDVSDTMNWNNLTKFKGEDIPIDQTLWLICHAPKLVECYLRTILTTTLNSSISLGDGPITHTGLRILEIDHPYYVNQATLIQFFQLITFRNLTACKINTPSQLVPTAFLRFLRRSCCPISRLELKLGRTTSSEDLINIAKTLPSVTKLSMLFDKPDYDTAIEATSLDSFFDALCLDSRYWNPPGDSNVVLLPFLEDLSIYTLDPFPCQWNRLPGLRYRYHYDGERRTPLPGRPSLKKLLVYHLSANYWDHEDKSDKYLQTLPTRGLIDSWETFSELLELQRDLELELKIKPITGYGPDNLFRLSLRKLEKTHGRAPKHIHECKSQEARWPHLPIYTYYTTRVPTQ